MKNPTSELPVLSGIDRLPQPTVDSDAPIIAGDPAGSRFADSTWRMGAAREEPGYRKEVTIKWDGWPNAAWLQVGKEVVWTRLNRRVGNLQKVQRDTSRKVAYRLRGVPDILFGIGVELPSEVSAETEFFLISELRTRLGGAAALRHALVAYSMLWRLRNHIGSALPRKPFRGQKVSRIAKETRRSENATPTVPVGVMRPYLDGCLLFIAEAREALQVGQVQRGDFDVQEAEPSRETLDTEQRISKWLQRREELRRGVPGKSNGTINWVQIKREAAVDPGHVRKDAELRAAISVHLRDFGLDLGEELSPPEYANTYNPKGNEQRLKLWLDRRTSALPTKGTRDGGSPVRCDAAQDHPVRSIDLAYITTEAGLTNKSIWFQDRPTVGKLWALLRKAVDRLGKADAPERMGSGVRRVWLRDVRAACFVVVAYLTGMRHSEVRSLMPRSVLERPSEDGATSYFWIEGRTFKGKRKSIAGDRRGRNSRAGLVRWTGGSMSISRASYHRNKN